MARCRGAPRHLVPQRASRIESVDARNAVSQRLSKWGLVHGWLVAHGARRIAMRATADGFVVTAEDPFLGEHAESVAIDEDPSSAAWRAITRLNGTMR